MYNVQDVSVSGVKFKDTQDHSKWAITKNEAKGITCIGDINREVSFSKITQRKIVDLNLWGEERWLNCLIA